MCGTTSKTAASIVHNAFGTHRQTDRPTACSVTPCKTAVDRQQYPRVANNSFGYIMDNASQYFFNNLSEVYLPLIFNAI